MSLSPGAVRRIAEEVRQQVEQDPHAALARARRLHQQASEHKRLANSYRTRAQVARLTFSEFKRNLESLGITVIIEDRHTAPEGGQSERSHQEGL